MTTHPTKPGQTVRCIRSEPALGLRIDDVHEVSAASFEWKDYCGIAVQLNGGGPWLRADFFEVVEPPKPIVIRVTSKEQAERLTVGHLAGKSIRGVLRDYDVLDTIPYITPSRQVGKTAYADFQRKMFEQITKALGVSYADMARDAAAAQRSSRLAALITANSHYGKLGSRSYDVPALHPMPTAQWLKDLSLPFFDPFKDPEPMSIIPPLEVPAAPAQPAPEPLPPESASVQMLRKLLEDRRVELGNYEDAKESSLEDIADLERQIASERESLADAERGIAAATQAIEEILADIAKLGGRAEPGSEKSEPAADEDAIWVQHLGNIPPVGLTDNDVVEVDAGRWGKMIGKVSAFDWGKIVAYRQVAKSAKA